MEIRFWIEVSVLVLACASVAGVIVQRIWTNKGIGIRAIQFVAIVTIPCFLVVLGLEQLLDKSAIAAVLGGMAGYVFAKPSVAKEDDEA